MYISGLCTMGKWFYKIGLRVCTNVTRYADIEITIQNSRETYKTNNSADRQRMQVRCVPIMHCMHYYTLYALLCIMH